MTFDFSAIETAFVVDGGAASPVHAFAADDGTGRIFVIDWQETYEVSAAGVETAWTTGVWGGDAMGATLGDGTFLSGTARFGPGTADVNWEHLANAGAHGWSDSSLSPKSMTIGPDGTIWGASASRDFWQWSAAGTAVLRHYNNNATGGGDVRWPDAPLNILFDSAGVLYAVGDDGIFKFDYIEDEWPTRAEEGSPDWPGEYLMHFTRLVANETSFSSYPPAGGYDTSEEYSGGAVLVDDRIYWSTIGPFTGTGPPTIFSVKTDGTDLTTEYTGNLTDGTDAAYFMGLAVIDGDLHVAGNNTSTVYKFAAVVTLTLGPTVGFIGPGLMP